ncbi:MAG: M15 family metallopeptidase [Vallitalea sp.]|jgi:LAS superfamily LD-carboxypeptidase LdcB|nr:M15 family metallopeptidase [Vallitalea sp.]
MHKKSRKIALSIVVISIAIITITYLMKDKDDVSAKVDKINNTKISEGETHNKNVEENKLNNEVYIKELIVPKDNIILSNTDKYKLSIKGLLSDDSTIQLANNTKLISHSDSQAISLLDGNIVVSKDANDGDKANITLTYEGKSVVIHITIKNEKKDNTQTNKNDVQDTKATENEVKDTKEPEVKKLEIKEPEVKKPDVKKSEIKETEVKDNNTVATTNDSKEIEDESKDNNNEVNNNNIDVNNDDTIKIDENGKKILINCEDIHVLVNKERNLPSDYVPKDLVKPNIPYCFTGENEKRYLRKIAGDALEKLVAQAKEDGIKIVGVSGYRSYKKQKAIFNYNVKKRGFEKANQVSAKPGQSEHQTGLAIDVSCASLNYKLEEKLGELKEGIWLRDNAHKFGFIIRYKKGKEDITGYQYEPWHIRYVGEEYAKEIYEQDVTYEEYLGLK